MTDHPFIALGLGLLVESACWTRLRWNFDDNTYIRAWQISVITSAATAIYVWLDGDRLSALQRLLAWLPALFLPVQLAQAYGLRDSMPLSTFSFFARQRQLRNQRLGLRDTSTRFNFGNVYFASCLIASTLGEKANSVWFLIGLIGLTGWIILAARQTRWAPLALAMAVAGCLAIGGQVGLTVLHEKVMRHYGRNKGPRSPDVTQTAIGDLGEIKQSQNIQWRLKPRHNHLPPRYLRTVAFNKYGDGRWQNQRAQGKPADFDWAAIDETTEGSNRYVITSNEAKPPAESDLPSFSLRGAVEEESQLPLPGDAAIIHDFKLEKIDHNSLGTVRISPSNAIIDGTVFWQYEPTVEIPPEKPDLDIPNMEEQVILSVARELKLAGVPTLEAKLELLGNWFEDHFRYTKYNRIEPMRDGEFGRSTTAIAVFLTTERRGHCEYYATAAALLLRAADIPTRYAVGFSVKERDSRREEFVLRGTHAHAWCRVWDAQAKRWIDFDPTPGNWLEMEHIRTDWSQWFQDWLLRAREDFALWRTDSHNRMGLAIGMISVGVVAFIFIGRRLWKSKHVVNVAVKGQPVFETTRTPLHDLEPAARDILGPRPPGLPFSRWLLGLKESIGKPEQLDEAIRLHQRMRYDPAPPDAPPLERLKALVDEIKAALP